MEWCIEQQVWQRERRPSRLLAVDTRAIRWQSVPPSEATKVVTVDCCSVDGAGVAGLRRVDREHHARYTSLRMLIAAAGHSHAVREPLLLPPDTSGLPGSTLNGTTPLVGGAGSSMRVTVGGQQSVAAMGECRQRGGVAMEDCIDWLTGAVECSAAADCTTDGSSKTSCCSIPQCEH